MPRPTVEACFFVDEPPEIEFRDGLFHITQTVGNYRYERVMRPNVFLKSFRVAAEAIQTYGAGADVIPFVGRDKEEVAGGH